MQDAFYRSLSQWLEQGIPFALCTVVRASGSVPRQPGAKMLVRADGSIEGSVGGGALERAVIAAGQEALQLGETRLLSYKLKPDLGMQCGGAAEVFVEPILPAERLYIFGGGHIGSVLGSMAARCGFAVTVIDERRDIAQSSRFPEAVGLLHSYDSADWVDLVFDEYTYCVVVTHSHQTDALVVRSLMDRRPTYIGMIGSSRKRAAVERELRQADIDAGRIEQLHTPMGLSIGAETPEEIAVSILAELIKIRRNRGEKE